MTALSIAEVSKRTKLSTHTLRYYERIGLVANIGRDGSGQRRYVETDLGWIDFIQMLRKTGMPLEQIAQFVELEKLGPTTVPERRRSLQQQRERLYQHIAELNQALAALDNKIDYYANANPQNCSCMSAEQANTAQ
jgi:DNA-binding transcriptional MerR regulator